MFDQLATEMSLYIDSISAASAKRLQKAFKRGFGNDREDFGHFGVSALAPLKPLNDTVEDVDVVADRVSIETSSGKCVTSGASLRLIDLEKHQKRKLRLWN